MFIEKDKSDCIESLITALKKTSRWRAKLANQYDDSRNAVAERKLAQLAVDAPTLSDATGKSCGRTLIRTLSIGGTA
jgi:hypothetical protein